VTPLQSRDVRALIVSYSFPPVGGAGVQRVVKLVKYLPMHRVRPAVLTVANPSVPLRDESLVADVPASVEVERARTLEPGYAAKQSVWSSRGTSPSGAQAARGVRAHAVAWGASIARHALFPDPQVLWQPAAARALALRLAARRDDVVLFSGPPFSQFLLAPLARAGRIGVVLDYRDEWSTLRSSYEMASSPVARALGDPLEAALLHTADAVVTATEDFRARLLERFRFVDPGRVFAVPNGFDPDDFGGDLPGPPDDRFVVTYAGTVFRLTSARGVLSAVRLLHERSPALAALLRMRFIGRIVDTELAPFEGTENLGVARTAYVPHAEVLRALSASHVTLCLLDDVAGTERIYPAKIFELMRLGRTVLTVAPDHGALARLVAQHRTGPVVSPGDAPAIAAVLASWLDDFRRGDFVCRSWQNAADVARYDRRALAGEFAAILRDAASSARRRAV
jgi:glycosyltransferase involved in cell wall biosynthesis